MRRSVGATLLIPLGIVVAAGLVAVVGGGLGGLASLSQIAAGPALPDSGSVIDSNPALAGLAGSPALGGGAAGAASAGSTAAGGAGGSSASAGGTTVGGEPTGGGGVPPAPGAPGGPAPGPDGPTSTGTEPPTTVTGPPVGPGPPVRLPEELDDVTSGLDESLPGPLRPVTDGLLDVLAPNP